MREYATIDGGLLKKTQLDMGYYESGSTAHDL